MVFVENDSFRGLRRLPTDVFRSIPRLPREDVVLPVAASDLVAWYPFREGTGVDVTAGDSRFGDTTDYSATVNGATFQASGGVTDTKTGANSGAFDFDGTDDSLDLGTVADSDQSLTLMAWVRPDTVSKSQRVITKRNGNTDRSGSLFLTVLSTGTIGFFISAAGSFIDVRSTQQLTANQFAHAAARYDFSAKTATVFLNGQSQGTVTVGQAAALSSQPWRLGQSNPIAFSVFLNGTLDDSRIYQAALSDSQINQIYLNTKP